MRTELVIASHSRSYSNGMSARIWRCTVPRDELVVESPVVLVYSEVPPGAGLEADLEDIYFGQLQTRRETAAALA